MSMALDNEPHRFRDAWLDDLAAMCGLAEPELRLLKRLRSGVGYRIDEAALRRAVTETRRARPGNGRLRGDGSARSREDTACGRIRPAPGA
jgi:hypothetical protein